MVKGTVGQKELLCEDDLRVGAEFDRHVGGIWKCGTGEEFAVVNEGYRTESIALPSGVRRQSARKASSIRW